MEANVAVPSENKPTWGGGGVKPFGASYGKMMMWFFIVSDALTFSGFLAAYGLTRFKFIDSWPIADEVFTHIPFIHGEYPMYYVAFMTFVLIFSSVTMVLAVDAGHKMNKKKVIWYMFATILGGLSLLDLKHGSGKHLSMVAMEPLRPQTGKYFSLLKRRK